MGRDTKCILGRLLWFYQAVCSWVPFCSKLLGCDGESNVS